MPVLPRRDEAARPVIVRVGKTARPPDRAETVIRLRNHDPSMRSLRVEFHRGRIV